MRRNIPPRLSAWRRFVQAGGPGALAMAVVFVTLASLLVVFPVQSSRFRAGQPLPKRYARVGFAVASEDLTRVAREAEANRTPPTLVVNTNLQNDLEKALLALPEQLAGKENVDQLPAEPRGQFEITEQALPRLQRFTQRPEYTEFVARQLAELRKPPILVTQSDRAWLDPRAFTTVKLQTPSGDASAEQADVGSLRREENLARKLDMVIGTLSRTYPGLQEAEVRESFRTFLRKQIAPASPDGEGRPTYRLDRARTTHDIEQAKARVPQQVEEYAADEVIFEGGIVREANLPVLLAEQQAYEVWLRDPSNPGYDPHRDLRIAVGRTGLVLLVVAVMGGYIARYQPRVIANIWRMSALAALLLLLMALAKVIVFAAQWPYSLTVGLAAMGAIIVTITYDQRFALAIGTMLALLLAMEIQMLAATPFMVLMSGVVVNVFLLKEIRTRTKLIEVGALAAVATFVTALLMQFHLGVPWSRPLLYNAAWGGGAVLAVGFIIQGILPAVERTFRIATSMTLLELCDANNRLLKRLAIEAPGTYNHSLLLGTLCEAAAESVGANGLLARTGAYYHDIGKINKPEYFIENKETGSPNKHDKLSPAMSLLIIVGHVKDGLEMAREYNLPPVLHEFIASHHGTTLVQYFYHAAAEQRRAAGGDRMPEEVEFRYPGPKPRSKECAILMFADAVESSVRAMSDPTPARIETQAHAMITARLMDGQLDECDLTLREVHEIERSLVKGLQAMYHGRIAYPKTTTRPAGESGEGESHAARA